MPAPRNLSACALLLVALLAPAAGAAPSRIASINLCTDQLLLLLADPAQIASISRLAREPESSYMADRAAAHPVNDARAEQLLALDPDLILAGRFSPRPLLRLLRRLGYRVETIGLTTGIADIRANIRRVAGLIGHSGRGEALIAAMDARLRAVADRIDPESPRPGALFYQPRGYTSGRDTLQDQALTLAGWRNLAAEAGIEGYGHIDLERLLAGRPQQLFTSAYAPGTRSLAQHLLQHPALRRVTGDRPMINIDYRYWICGGPMIADAVEALARTRP